MKQVKRLAQAVCILLAAFSVTAEAAAAEGRLSLQYRETMGESIRTRQFLVEPSGQEVAIQSSVEDDWFFTVCDDSGNTRQWHVDKAASDFMAVRSGNTITISGTADGQRVDKKLTKNELPWFQSLYYSLSRFVRSEKQQIEFWMIRPDNLSLVKLRAEKEEMETIPVNGRPESAQKVRLAPTGLLSFIWHGYYWYRPGDGVLLLYKDMKALPGRSKLMVRLCHAQTPETASTHLQVSRD